MVSNATKRRRRERANRSAMEVEDRRNQAMAEKDTLGTVIGPDAPDAKLFSVDRQKTSHKDVQQELQAQAAEQKRDAKRSRRGKKKVRRSEAAIYRDDTAIAKHNKGKKRKGVGQVEKDILMKRRFDKPKGHVGNISEGIRAAKVYIDGKEDVWMGDMSKTVKKEIGSKRKHLVNKMNIEQRSAASVVPPSAGLSVNPRHEDHQDKLGEALSKIMKEDDEKNWALAKMRYDPLLREESREGDVGDTGMKVDDEESSETEPLEDEEMERVAKAIPERKTRSQRNKEARKREMQRNIRKKRRNEKQALDFINIEAVAQEAIRLADKVSGEEKLRKLKENPPPPKPTDAPVTGKIAGQIVRNEAALEPYCLSAELSEAMRNIEMPVANPMMRDRFLSFERRGLIAPPKVLPKEVWRMEQAKRQEQLKDRRKRKGRGSASKLTFWKNGKKAIK